MPPEWKLRDFDQKDPEPIPNRDHYPDAVTAGVLICEPDPTRKEEQSFRAAFLMRFASLLSAENSLIMRFNSLFGRNNSLFRRVGVVAGRYIDLKERDSLAAAESAVRSYRRRMADYAEMRAIEVWYDHINVEQVIAALPRARQKLLSARVKKARTRNVAEHDFPKLTESTGQQPQIRTTLP